MVYNVDIKGDCMFEQCKGCEMKKCADNPDGPGKINIKLLEPEEFLKNIYGSEYVKDLPIVHECGICGCEFESHSWDDECCPRCLNSC